MPLIIPANTLSTGGYEVANSCRFNDDDTAFLSKTFSGDGTHHDKGTVSFWVKRGELTDEQGIFTAGSSDRHLIRFETSGSLSFRSVADSFHLITTQLFRDPSAWYHIVIAYDTSQGTEGNRVKFYVNGTQVTSFGTETYPSQNLDIKLGAAELNCIGKDSEQTNPYLDGYLSEFVYIDGTQLTPTSFGEFDTDGSPSIWKPIDVSGLTFGTNGFYLDFEDSADLGADVSGNSNDFTVNNLAATDQATDTPTNNFATLNPLIPSGLTYSEGNLGSARTDSGNRAGYGTFGVTAGKWYWEVKCVAAGTASAVGIGKETNMSNANQGLSQYAGSETNDIGYYTDGNINESGSSIDSETSWTDGDIISVAMDLDNNKVYFAKNGTWQNSGDPSAGSNGYSITNSSDTFFPQISHHGATDASALSNFGTPPFSISSSNSDPNGYGSFEYGTENFYAICTKNLAEYG